MTRVSFFNSFLLGLAIFQSASCHFQLIYPPTRGFDETKEPTVPCGGFDTASIPRTPFPLTGAFVEIDAGHTSYTYTVNVLLKSDPVTADFTGSKLVPVSEGTRNYPQKTCIALDFSRSKATSGTDATLQIIFNGGDGELYQVKR
jgi:hypothetical protein